MYISAGLEIGWTQTAGGIKLCQYPSNSQCVGSDQYIVTVYIPGTTATDSCRGREDRVAKPATIGGLTGQFIACDTYGPTREFVASRGGLSYHVSASTSGGPPPLFADPFLDSFRVT